MLCDSVYYIGSNKWEKKGLISDTATDSWLVHFSSTPKTNNIWFPVAAVSNVWLRPPQIYQMTKFTPALDELFDLSVWCIYLVGSVHLGQRESCQQKQLTRLRSKGCAVSLWWECEHWYAARFWGSIYNLNLRILKLTTNWSYKCKLNCGGSNVYIYPTSFDNDGKTHAC